MTLKRLLLHDALSPPDLSVDCQLHAWNQETHDVFKLDSITLKDLGTLKVPLEERILVDIVLKCQNKGGFESEGSSCYLVNDNDILAPKSSFLKQSLSQLIDMAFKEKFGPGLESVTINIDVSMTSLLICSPSEDFIEIPTHAMHTDDAFGMMLMQLPVGSGTTVAAEVASSLHWRKERLDYQQKPPFYLTFLVGNGNEANSLNVNVKSSQGNPMAFLVSNLVWLDSCRLFRNPRPMAFLSFLEKLKLAAKALIGWKSISVDLSDMEHLRKARNEPGFEGGTKIPVLDAQQTTLLCIPARHSYRSVEFKIDNLKPEDKRIVGLLELLHDIDFSIAVLKIQQDFVKYGRKWELHHQSFSPHLESYQKIEETCSFVDWKKEAANTEGKTFAIHRSQQGCWAFPASHEKFASLRFDCHLVGDVKSIIEDAEEEETSRERLKPVAKSSKTYHPVILIRPRQAAILDCWNHCPLETVQCLTRRFNLAVKCDFNRGALERRVFILEVQHIVKLITEDEEKLHDACQRTAILHQLLHMCTALKAIHEGFKIMELIPQKQCKCSSFHKGDDLEDFFDEKRLTIEDVVGNLVLLVGWKTCSNLVDGIYSSYDKDDYYSVFNMSFVLKKNGFFREAIHMAKKCIKILAESKSQHDVDWDWEDFDYFVGLPLSDPNNDMEEERKDLYASLGIAALTVDHILLGMINYYLQNVTSQLNLIDLHSAIIDLIFQMEYDEDEDIIASVICFPYRTRNTELADRLWSKLFISEKGKEQEGYFEQILSRIDSVLDFSLHEDLYKAIALSSWATERFYKFIDKRKANRNICTFRICLYHLTMAEREPSLAHGQVLQSYLSIFKEMNVQSLVKPAKAIVRHNQSRDTVVPISQTIVSYLFECLPTSDFIGGLSQETGDFSKAMCCYIILGNDMAKRRLLQTLKEHLPDDSDDEDDEEEDLVSISGEIDDQLLETWLVCLKWQRDNGEINRTIAAYQILQYAKVYCDIKGISTHYGVWHEDLSGWSSNLSNYSLEETLIALFERECFGTSQCLKAKPAHWNICKTLSYVLITDSTTKTLISHWEPNRIVKLMCCILWLGSKFATETLVNLIDKFPLDKARYCLSLLIVSNQQLQQCATSSPQAFSALQKIILGCIKPLFASICCFSSWSRPIASTIDDLAVQKFYQSHERSRKFGPFQTSEEAKNFIKSVNKGLPSAVYAVKTVEKSYFCEIEKLYPTLLDGALSNLSPSLGQTLSVSFEELFGQRACDSVERAVSKLKCAVCLAPSIKTLRNEC